MNAARIFYRTYQFWIALQAKPARSDLEHISSALTPLQRNLFLSMQPGEQAHSIQVYHKLRAQGESHPDLLAAALLHDVGKSLYPLRLWERAVIVLAKALLPEQVKRWGSDPSGKRIMRSWRRAFVIAEQHPAWGAEMAAQAGASSLAVRLIRRHQEILRLPKPQDDAAGPKHPAERNEALLEDTLLWKLQSVDDES